MTAWHDCSALQRDLLKTIADHDHYDRAATADALQIAVETRREATRLDTVLQAAEPALADDELALLEAVSTYLRNTDGFGVQTHAEPAIRSHALDVIATTEDGEGAPAGDVLDTLAQEYGADRALTALLDLLVQGECYQPEPATLRRVDTDTDEPGGDR